MLVSKAIPDFLSAQRQTALRDWFLKFGVDLECQVNVARGDGQPVPGKKSTFSDGLNQWWHIRIPHDARTDESHWTDYPLKWPLAKHAECIGTTGWLWTKKKSLGFGFDFDSIVGHKDAGLSDEELANIKELASKLPYLTITRSSSGRGLHLWLMLSGEGVTTNNHTEHKALARWLLGKMSMDIGFDFNKHLDVCGSNMWIWHRNANDENKGYELLKQGEPFPVEQIADNWRDHIAVIKSKRTRVVLPGVAEDEMDLWDSLTSANRIVPLDDEHRAFMDAHGRIGFSGSWESDHHCFYGHTYALKVLHEQRKYIGEYHTISAGNNPDQPNCFMYPRENGAWKVVRFGEGTQEHETWEQDGEGYTQCWYNFKPDLRVAAKAHGGRDTPTGGYEVPNLEAGRRVIQALGGPSFEIPIVLEDRRAVVRTTTDGRVCLDVIKGHENDAGPGWTNEDKKIWSMVFDIPSEPPNKDATDYDNQIRCLQTVDYKPAGWAVFQPNQKAWGDKNASSVKTVFQNMGHSKPEAEILMGAAERNPWRLVSEPFEIEYPGDRKWNRDAIRYMYEPLPRDAEISHPTWDMVLNHAGSDLDKYIKNLEWARQYGFTCGGDYLKAYYANILRHPHRRLPYLFFFGPQNSGKSIVHEAFGLLVNKGVVKADRALRNRTEFNGEIANSILCVVEERDIATSEAAARIKDLVTGLYISVRQMRMDSYDQLNKTHWIQCNQKLQSCLVEPGDTRIVVMFVDSLENCGLQDVPKEAILIPKLKEEAPAFMRTLMDMELPPPMGRLGLPVISTHHKWQSEEFSRDYMAQFLRDRSHHVPGAVVPFREFYEKFLDFVPLEDRHNWQQKTTKKALPPQYCVGDWDGQVCVGNVSWKQDLPGKPLVLFNGKLQPDL